VPRGIALIAAALLALTALISPSVPSFAFGRQTFVSGTLTTPEGRPAPDRQIHFENRVSGVLYLMRTDADGSFATHLPPGVYDLREESGTIIRRGIAVSEIDADIGKVSEPVAGFWFDPFQFEQLGERIIDSPAPATANLPGSTMETHPVPAPSPSAAPR
jgi:hypothetical protein